MKKLILIMALFGVLNSVHGQKHKQKIMSPSVLSPFNSSSMNINLQFEIDNQIKIKKRGKRLKKPERLNFFGRHSEYLYINLNYYDFDLYDSKIEFDFGYRMKFPINKIWPGHLELTTGGHVGICFANCGSIQLNGGLNIYPLIPKKNKFFSNLYISILGEFQVAGGASMPSEYRWIGSDWINPCHYNIGFGYNF